MSTIAGVGRSPSLMARRAGAEAAQEALRALAGRAPEAALVFGTCGHDQSEMLAGVREVLPGAALAGCSGEGVIAGPVSDEVERSVAVMALASDTMTFHSTIVTGYGADPAAAGRALAEWVRGQPHEDALALLVFPDGLSGNCSVMLTALEGALPRPIPVVGGAAGDAMRLKQTYQYAGDRVESGALSALLIRGRGSFTFALSHGCTAIGLPRRVTEAEGSWLRAIDGRPAWAVLREYLDGDPEDLNAEGISHVSFAEEIDEMGGDDAGRFVIRTPLGLDRDNGSLLLPGGGLANGTPIRLVRRDPPLIRESARRCAERIAGRHPGQKPAFVLQFDCAGRGRSLFGSCVAEEIVHPLQRQLGPDVPWIGFHSYGEIAPAGGRSRYHNYTVALCAVYDGTPG